jgi:hypothetical protein
MKPKKRKKIILKKHFARVPLTQGKFAKIDLREVDRVSKHSWFYAIDHARAIIKNKSVRLHNFIMRRTKKTRIHFKNGDLLDFRKHNMELVSLKFIHQKKGKIKTPTSSQFKGVSWHSRNWIWQAYIRVNKIRKYLGSFEDEGEAALSYNEAALKYFGKHAFLNII